MDAERTNERDTSEEWVASRNVPALSLCPSVPSSDPQSGRGRRLKRGGGAWQESVRVRHCRTDCKGRDFITFNLRYSSYCPTPPRMERSFESYRSFCVLKKYANLPEFLWSCAKGEGTGSFATIASKHEYFPPLSRLSSFNLFMEREVLCGMHTRCRRGIALYGTKCHRMNPQCGPGSPRQYSASGRILFTFLPTAGTKSQRIGISLTVSL